jgi:hypothetical protein
VGPRECVGIVLKGAQWSGSPLHDRQMIRMLELNGLLRPYLMGDLPP